MARSISIEAYRKHIETGKAKTQWIKIYEFMRRRQPLTRSEISERTGIRMSSVCGRVKELLDAGLLIEEERRKCMITHEPAHPVGTDTQGELF